MQFDDIAAMQRSDSRLLPILIVAAFAASTAATIVLAFYGIYFFFFFIPLVFGLPWSEEAAHNKARKQWNIEDMR